MVKVPPRRNVQVSAPLLRRLEEMRDQKILRLGRTVTISEIIGDLMEEHDKAMEANPI